MCMLECVYVCAKNIFGFFFVVCFSSNDVFFPFISFRLLLYGLSLLFFPFSFTYMCWPFQEHLRLDFENACVPFACIWPAHRVRAAAAAAEKKANT